MSLYLDASTIIPNLVEEASSGALKHFLFQASEPLVVSDLAAVEINSAIGRLVRMGLVARVAASSLLEEFDAWRAAGTVGVNLQPGDFQLATLFLRHFELGLRAPDALHVAVCRREGHRLVTLDRRMMLAATTLGVDVDQPG